MVVAKLKRVIIVLRISQLIYGVFGMLCFFAPVLFIFLYFAFNFLPPDFENASPAEALIIMTIMSWFAALSLLVPAIFIQFVIRDLKRGCYWAYVAAIIVCGIYLPSIFIVLGVIGLLGLVDHEVSDYFHQQRKR